MTIGRSLHVGLDRVDPTKYFGWPGRLDGPVNDARAMMGLARTNGFEPRLLINEQATAQAVLDEIDEAREAIVGEGGGTFLITFAGHGGRDIDRERDESDGRDESWVLSDRILFDDELYRQWSLFPDTANIVIVADSCHSGTSADVVTALLLGSTGRSLSIRAIPDEVLEQTIAGRPDVYTPLLKANGVRPPLAASAVSIAACHDDDLTGERNGHGIFTQKLLDVVDALEPADYVALQPAIAAALPPSNPELNWSGPGAKRLVRSKPFTILASASNAHRIATRRNGHNSMSDRISIMSRNWREPMGTTADRKAARFTANRGTDGVANLRVITDYGLEGERQFWFELHTAVRLTGDDATASAAAATLNTLLARNPFDDKAVADVVAFIMDNGEIDAARVKQLALLLGTIYKSV